MAYFKS